MSASPTPRAADRVRFASQPSGVPWPTRSWHEAAPGDGADPARVEAALARVFSEPPPEQVGETRAVVVIHRGALVAERYAAGFDRDSSFLSWSMAKSVLHAVIGILVRDGKLDPRAPAPVPAWRERADDPRAAITTEHLLRMSSGLCFLEDYVDEARSDVIAMLFGAGKQDVAGFAESFPLEHPAGTAWSYSSGTSNILSAITRRVLGADAEGYRRFVTHELFEPLGIRSAELRFDAAGTWIGSSFVYATARDFARFGLLYLRDGCWDGARILPAGWADAARTPTPGSEGQYGAHFWLSTDGSDVFTASGYRGQYIVMSPARDVVVVRLGDSTTDQRGGVYRFLADVVRAFPALAG